MLTPGVLMAGLALLGVVSDANAMRAVGKPSGGLQAAITVVPEAAAGQPVPVGLEVCNVSERPILIDNWIGNWFVDVELADGSKVMPIRSATRLRTPVAAPEFLPPGLCWTTALSDLCLVSALPGSTPDWRYEPLSPGAYSLRAVFESRYVGDYILAWTGRATSGAGHVVVK